MARRGENIHKRKDGRWEGRYIKTHTPDRRICWGYIYGTTYAEVKQRLIHKKSEYGGFQLIDAHLTFTELAEAWLQSVKCGLKESTCAHYQYTLYKYVLPILGTVPISRLEENILEQALQKIIAPPDGQHTGRQRSVSAELDSDGFPRRTSLRETDLSHPAKGGSTPAFAYQRTAIAPLPCPNL